ncbi:MAG TPA: cytochrome c peroxidase [Bacteroidota bacterium]|jgi:cytochrome c peroxidase|nr:cytochrome c peroxidase [Bacteroidota bacterium]
MASYVFTVIIFCLSSLQNANAGGKGSLDAQLATVLASHEFTGAIESKFKQKLNRPIDQKRANLGRLLWFDIIGGLNNDNTCGGCHSPTNGFGDTQPIAIGVDNNLVVGPGRTGPRNQRRTPIAANTALYPTLMWNSRFAALSGDPFDNSAGFQFPAPEGLSLSYQPHLLVAQAFIPPTERVEVAGFHFPGNNTDIRNEVLRLLNENGEYRKLFGQVFPEIAKGAPINFDHFGKAIAEFEFTLVFANAPLDRFARGERSALTAGQKRGAMLFFGEARCVQCHKVSGNSNEMFSDFRQHVIGVPQVAPSNSNMVFDGPGANEDFGLEQVTGIEADRYMFRTPPLRNAAVMPAFMHNGAFVQLEDAIRHHLDPFTSARSYSPSSLPPDLQGPIGPTEPVLARVDPLLQTPIVLSAGEFSDLVDFVRNGLLDPRILPKRLKTLVPKVVPSGRQTLTFEFNFSPTAAASETRVSRDENTSPTTAELIGSYPNPFNPSTTISYQLPVQSVVTLRVFDVLGREVATLVDGVENAGSKSVVWDASLAASGVYFYRLSVSLPARRDVDPASQVGRAEALVETKKFTLLR